MNELLNYLSNYAKKRKNKHRFSAVMVCLAVIVSFTVYIGLIEPAESASGQLACGMEEHEHTQDCFELICGFDDESEEEISVDTTEIGSEETTETACETEETTTETTETTTSTEVEETAPVHVHNDKCYRLICLTEAHLHKQDCYNQPVETTEPATTTETSASISTGTTMSTEQTTETTTTTTKLSEEVYELNAALFGELYMDRVSVLADSPVYIDEYKFYYVNGVLNAHSCFSYPDNATGNPNNNSIKRTYNGIEYKMAYSFEKNAENVRYITLKAPTNGTWILLFGDVEKTFNINIKYNDNVVKSQLFNDTSNGIMVVPVESGKTYKAYQNTDDESKARLVYAEFVPTVTPENGKAYSIRDVKTGLYLEVNGGSKENTNITIGQYSDNDNRNNFKFVDNGVDFKIYPQLSYDNPKVLDCSDDGSIKTYGSETSAPNRSFKFTTNNDGTFKINTYFRNDSNKEYPYKLYVDRVDNNYVKASTDVTGDDFIIVKADVLATFDTEKVYTIQNEETEKYISYSDNYDGDDDFDFKQVAAENYNNSDNNFKFKFEDAGDGYYYIRVLVDGLNDNYLYAYYNVANGNRSLNVTKKDELSERQKFKVIDNLDGTYTIHCNGGVIDASERDDTVKTWKDEDKANQQFLIAETSYTPPEIVYQKAEIDPDTTYLIKNVRSRLYVHNDDGNIVQQKDVGVESQFRFENKGDGKYYIHLPAADEWMTIGVENIENEADVKLSWSNNAFYAEKMENGSVRFYQENNGKKYYLGIPYTTVAAGANIALYEADSVEDQMCFFLVPVIEPVEVEEKHTRVEARVIFADYNDGKFELYKDTDDKVISGEKQAGDVKTNERNLYDEPAWTPTIELYKGNESNPIYTEKGNLVIDISEARKDWCYQYNYVWNLGTDTTNEYTVKLNGVNSGNKITLNGKEFKVYYLKDTELNHPGNNGNSNAPAEAYKQTPYSQAGDQIIYIFLDPVVEELWPNGNQPGTFDLSMKKRWDGHNSDGFDNRKKEKIQIQLQKLVTENGVEKWVEYNPADLGENYRSIIYYEKDNISNNFVDKTFTYNNVPLVSADVPEDQKLTRVVPGVEGEVAWQTVDGDYVNKTVLEQAQGAKDGATVAKANRLELVLHYNEWNNVILSYDKGNKPSHFQEGYYMNWKVLPYGNYRVVETRSFYDANDNDVFDEGDRDTSNEYYYMSYPPMRDSRGVLHIQNFTKDMVLDIQKEWYDDQGTVKLDNPGKTVKVNIYRSLKKKNNPAANDSELELVYPDVDVLNDNIILKTTDKHPELLLKTTSEQKYYYYIQEVSVDGYLLLNGNDEGFVKSTNGNYYVDYEDGDGRKFIIENKAKVGIKLEKEWYTDKNSNSKMTFAEGSEPNAEFEVYVADRFGTPILDETATEGTKYPYKVEYKDKHNPDGEQLPQTDLIHIADAKIDKTGKLEIIGGDINDGNGTSKVMSNQLHIYGTEEVFKNEKTFVGDTTSKGVFEVTKIGYDENEKYYTFGGESGSSIIWIKPQHEFGGTLELTFTNVQSDDQIKIGNYKGGGTGYLDSDKYNGVLSSYSDYIQGKDLKVSYELQSGGNYRLVKEAGNPKLKSAVFYPYNYYYIREKTSDTCELINGDSNGFVVLQDANKYYLNLSADSDETRYPIVTAKNVPKVNLDITKKWHNSNNGEITTIDKSMRFQIYTAYENTNSPNVNSLEVYKDTLTVKTGNNNTSQITYNEKGEYYELTNGSLNIIDLPAFKIGDDQKYHKLYYYVREIEGNYTTSNAINGFIPYESGQYGTAFDDTSSNSGKYNFVNTPKLEITVNKTWLDEKGNEDDKKAKTEIKFELYRKIENGTSELIKDGENNFFITEKHKKLIQNLDAYDSSGKKYNYYIVEISSDGNYSVDNYIVTYSVTNASWDKYDECPVINVTNQAKPQNYELPETGGIGTHGYTVAGGAIILLSAMILLFKRRTQL